MIHESPSNVIPWFSFFLFLSFLCHMQEDKSFYWNYVSHFCRDLIHVRHRLTFYRVLFPCLFDDLIQDDAHGTSKDTPSHLFLVCYVLCFFFCFFPFHSFCGTLLHEQRILIYLANNTIELELSFERTGYLVYVCVNTGGEFLGLSLFFYFPGVICGSVLSRRDDGWWMSGWMEWNEWKYVILHTHILLERYIKSKYTSELQPLPLLLLPLPLLFSCTYHIRKPSICSHAQANAASVRVCMWRNDVYAYRGQGSKLYVYSGVYQSSKSRAP